jgi:hypothetical protein
MPETTSYVKIIYGLRVCLQGSNGSRVCVGSSLREQTNHPRRSQRVEKPEGEYVLYFSDHVPGGSMAVKRRRDDMRCAVEQTPAVTIKLVS